MLQISYVQPAAQSKVLCGPVEGFVRPSLGLRCSKSMLYPDNLSLF